MRGRRKLNLNKNPKIIKIDISRLESRNRKLAARYYYYARLHGIAYEVIVQERLPEELDLAPRTIVDLLMSLTDEIAFFKKNEYSIADLRKEYPYFVWKEPAQLSLF